MKETSTDFLPAGYIQEESSHNWYIDCPHMSWYFPCPYCSKPQEPFKLTEEEYQWLISLCCRGQA